MKRREFIALVGGAAAVWPLTVHAQQPAMPVIGWLSARTPETDALVLPAFRRGLNDQGYVENRNVAIEYRFANGLYDRLPALAADLVSRRVAVVVTGSQGELSIPALRATHSTIPIVFTMGNDPVKLGLVASLNRPGGNITGIYSVSPALGSKRLGLLRELLPSAAAIAILVNPTNTPGTREVTDVQEGARALGQQVTILNASTERDLDAAFASLVQIRVDALFVATDPFFVSRADQIVALAARHAVPTIYWRRDFAVVGGLISYGTSSDEAFRKLGDYTGRILKGVKAADLPIDQITKVNDPFGNRIELMEPGGA
jgi:putative ABC transport system substrate-binding protein